MPMLSKTKCTNVSNKINNRERIIKQMLYMPQLALDVQVVTVLEAVWTFSFELGHVCSMVF